MTSRVDGKVRKDAAILVVTQTAGGLEMTQSGHSGVTQSSTTRPGAGHE
jgi:hypothetical protein